MLDETILVQDLSVAVYVVPTDAPEMDGTIAWDSTTMIVVRLQAGGKEGLGYTYAHSAAAEVIDDVLKPIIIGQNAIDIPALNYSMIKAIRNNGASGLAMMAVSAVDIALWDLKGKIFDMSLVKLLGKQKDEILLYGSGGFTSYSITRLQQQFHDWVNGGVKYVKMKIGTHPDKDPERVKAAREAIGENTALFVDANGAYTARQAIDMAERLERYKISWFEEPVPSDDTEGLNFIRQQVPGAINIAAGEYGYSLAYYNRMLMAKSVDILQADATRCGGITGFLQAGVLCAANQIPYSSHCAPSVHLHAAQSLPAFYIAEYFYDHARIEEMFFDGVTKPIDGRLRPDCTKPGLGLSIKTADVEQFRV